ncbi:MAG: phosphate ABC transporter permease subunit PstC [Deltaproteobacteria bacterium]|nr:phosphate ABC transporter permease subunit PstC [Deltaproteobacteria bacterium]
MQNAEVKIKRAASEKFRTQGFSLDKAFQGLLVFISFVILLVLFAIVLELLRSSWLSLKTFGFSFLVSQVWDPVAEKYGALSFIYGTLASSLIAMLIAVPISLGSALFITQWAPSWLRNPISFLIELLAAIPSVIYGLWAIFVLIPFIRNTFFPSFFPLLGSIKLFEGPAYGPSLLAGGMVLSIMILPTITSVTKEIFLTIPQEYKEGVYALGGTQWESIIWVVLRLSRSGIIGACVLGLGRAIGETMAVTMVIGNRPEVSASIFAPAYSLASVIANEFAEATSPLYLSSLSKMGLLLLVITLIVNVFARLLVGKAKKR